MTAVALGPLGGCGDGDGRMAARVQGPQSSAARLGVPDRLATFERGFAAVDWRSAKGASLRTVPRSAGGRAIRAGYDGARSGFARTWFSARIRGGSELWYGAEFLLHRDAPRWMSLLRWDNRRSYGKHGDVGGVEVGDGRRARMFREDYSERNYAPLGADFELPIGRWFWLEVHQRLSAVDGEALSEVFVDGRRVAHSTTANSRGRRVDEVRYGLVAFDEAPAAGGAIYFDRVSLAPRARGSRPRGGAAGTS